MFDVGKLDWLNARYLRETMDAPTFLSRVREWALNEEYLLPIAEMAQSRIEKLGDLGGLTAMFFQNRLDIDEAKLRDVKIELEEQRQAYQLALWHFDGLSAWDKPSVEGALRDTATKLDLKFKFMVRAFFIAITGSATSVPLFEATAHLGRDIVRERLRHALEILGAPSKKELKSWEDLLNRPAAAEPTNAA